mmetsp:Transcript_24703/g.69347  ORF Transcript_24703/g.69347 Transcript_24703/m.69347 type:complete len:235 (-) Transcript_24703:262-966(-)
MSAVLIPSLRVFLQESTKLLLVIRMPPAQWWPIFRDVLHGPSHAELVCLCIDVVVGADDVKVPFVHLFHHVVDDLLGHPCPVCWLILVKENGVLIERFSLFNCFRLCNLQSDRGIDPSRHKQTCAQFGIIRTTKVVLQTFRVTFQRCLGHVVGEVSRWHRDALLGSRVNDDARFTRFLHFRDEYQAAMDRAVHVDAHCELNRRHVRQWTAASSDTCIVHQEMALAAIRVHLFCQ